jgi:hypothetical protein
MSMSVPHLGKRHPADRVADDVAARPLSLVLGESLA